MKVQQVVKAKDIRSRDLMATADGWVEVVSADQDPYGSGTRVAIVLKGGDKYGSSVNAKDRFIVLREL